MKISSIMSTAALLSLVGIIGVGCAAEVGEAGDLTVDEAAVEKTTAEAETETETVSEAAAAETCSWDNCWAVHQACTSSNTGWAGYCDYGPIHDPCIYCHCD